MAGEVFVFAVMVAFLAYVAIIGGKMVINWAYTGMFQIPNDEVFFRFALVASGIIGFIIFVVLGKDYPVVCGDSGGDPDNRAVFVIAPKVSEGAP